MSLKSKNLCRFTRELDEKLIELVSQNAVLFDSTHKLYKDLNTRDNVWLAISSVIGKSVLDCKTRWRSLRDLYHRKKKEQKSGKRLRSPWEYMDAMRFLETFTNEKRSSQDNIHHEAEPDQDSKIEIKHEFDADLPSTSSYQESYIEESPIHSKRLKMDDHYLYENSSILEILREISSLAKMREDPTMGFFECMAKTVIKFPPAKIAEVRLKVCQIVTEMECKILEDAENLQLGEFD
ncbi:uncharacterized protein [Euwallacea fornicatus]|uniref:uncharacterized protein isoform X2 n=1 Tax=Euwallacea fornicatus TaxID=995702 RepID=UPI00338E5354